MLVRERVSEGLAGIGAKDPATPDLDALEHLGDRQWPASEYEHGQRRLPEVVAA
jgi:hypothetical protein